MFGNGGGKTLFEGIRNCLTVCDLGFVIHDSFSHAELVKFLSSRGLVYPGVRMQSIDLPELAHHFAADAWKDPVIFDILEKELDRRYPQDIKEMRDMPLEEIRRLISGARVLFEKKSVGKMLWLLLKDGRPEVMHLVPSFLKSVDKICRNLDREENKKMNFFKRFEKGQLTRGEIEALSRKLFDLEDENSRMQTELQEKQDRVAAAKRERQRTKDDLVSARGERDRLKNSSGKLEKEISEQAETIRQLREAMKGIPKSEKSELEHRIHDLARSERKREHELAELRLKISTIEGERRPREELCGRLKAENETAAAEKKALEAELYRCRQAMERQVPKSSPSPAPSILPQKGKRLGVFVDAASLRFAARQMQKKIDYRKLLEAVTGDRHLIKAVLYAVAFPGKDITRFLNVAERSGFEARSRELVRCAGGPEKSFWDMGIAVDALRFVEKNGLDIVHLVTGDGDFADLLKLLKARGVHAEVSAFPSCASADLVKCADRFIELGEEICLDDSHMFFTGSSGQAG